MHLRRGKGEIDVGEKGEIGETDSWKDSIITRVERKGKGQKLTQ